MLHRGPRLCLIIHSCFLCDSTAALTGDAMHQRDLQCALMQRSVRIVVVRTSSGGSLGLREWGSRCVHMCVFLINYSFFILLCRACLIDERWRPSAWYAKPEYIVVAGKFGRTYASRIFFCFRFLGWFSVRCVREEPLDGAHVNEVHGLEPLSD